jgi:hypothetical protein
MPKKIAKISGLVEPVVSFSTDDLEEQHAKAENVRLD